MVEILNLKQGRSVNLATRQLSLQRVYAENS